MASQQGKSQPLSPVRVQLKYFHQFQFAGYYAALEKGFYREAGLDVTLLEGGQIDPIQQVLDEKAEYGVASNDILIRRMNGDPLVLLASIFQRSASVFLCLEKSGIYTVHDLINKRIMVPEAEEDPELLAIFHNEGIPLNRINRISSSYNIDDLIDGKTDAINGYITNEPFLLKEKGIPYTIIAPKNYGIDFYGDCLFTTEQEIQENPVRSKEFLDATKKGWDYALNHTEEIIELIQNKYGVEKSREHLRLEAEAIKELVLNEYVEIGHINPGRWRNIADICVNLELIDPGYDLTGFIFQPDNQEHSAWTKWLFGIALILVILAIIVVSYLVLFNKYLKRSVKAQTQELVQKNQELRNEILERQRAEQTVKLTEDRFRLMVENLPAGAIYVEDNQMFVNRKVEEITGYSNSEIPDVDHWGRILFQEKRDELYDIYKEQQAHNFPTNTLAPIYCKSGEVKQVEFTAYKFDNKEIWLMHDVSERLSAEMALKKSEQKFRTYIESSPTGILILNRDTRILFVNPFLCQLLQYNEEELYQLTIPDLMADENLTENFRVLNTLLETGKTQGEVLAITQKGDHIPVYVNAIQISSEHYIAYVTDISQLKKVEEELIRAKEKAEESDRLKSAFLANMSHEIRTPMNGIMGFSKLLKNSGLSTEKRNQYIAIINRNGEQLLNIIENIMAISYLEVNQLKADPSEFSVTEMLSQIQVLFELEKGKMGKSHIQLRFHNRIPENQSQILSDEGKLKQILTNLINNALKFTTKGRIDVTAEMSDTHLHFTVKDTGIGIPREQQKLVFERFGQVEDPYTRQFGGAGLGLPISKGLVELLGGQIQLESEVNQGSTFTFTVPCKPASAPEQPNPGLPSNPNWADKTILVVEDVKINAMFIEEMLDKTNIRIHNVENGREALEFCKSSGPLDLILMDIQMPDMNGFDATREILSIRPNLPIIAQTAFATQEDEIRAREAGCSDYISKPIDPEQLIQKISHLI